MRAGDLPDQERELLEEGSYLIAAKKIEKKRGEGKVHSYLNIEYVVVSGESKGKMLFDIVSLSPKAIWKLKQWLLAFNVSENQELPIEKGADGALVVDEEALVMLVNELVRKQVCNAKVVIEEPDSNGLAKGYKTRNAISEYSPNDEDRMPWEN